MRTVAVLVIAAALSGCVSSHVRNGVIIGAVSGAAAGAGVGVLVSDEDLLGSENSPTKGDTSLGVPEAVAASAAIGVVFGAIVGGMVGHVNEPRYGRDLDDTSSDAEASPETAPTPAEPAAPAAQNLRSAATIRF